MAASRDDLRHWFDRGKELGATHMMVFWDTWDQEDLPGYVYENQDARTIAAERDGKEYQKLMEVYDLRLDREMQMAEYRAFHY